MTRQAVPAQAGKDCGAEVIPNIRYHGSASLGRLDLCVISDCLVQRPERKEAWEAVRAI
jgi:hypothetical protein